MENHNIFRSIRIKMDRKLSSDTEVPVFLRINDDKWANSFSHTLYMFAMIGFGFGRTGGGTLFFFTSSLMWFNIIVPSVTS